MRGYQKLFEPRHFLCVNRWISNLQSSTRSVVFKDDGTANNQKTILLHNLKITRVKTTCCSIHDKSAQILRFEYLLHFFLLTTIWLYVIVLSKYVWFGWHNPAKDVVLRITKNIFFSQKIYLDLKINTDVLFAVRTIFLPWIIEHVCVQSNAKKRTASDNFVHLLFSFHTD